ncbi:MAG: HDOD domain-containing protein [Thermomonas sp.]
MLILFVSNDNDGAARLEADLSGHSLDWQFSWTNRADVALACSPSPDVLVCADQIGSRRGLTLLDQLRGRHPDAVRILLMDAGHDQDAMQAMEVAHRVLPEPLDSLALFDAIKSVLELRALLGNPALKNAIARVGSLPTAPRQYLALTRLLRDPGASAASIVEVVTSDPAVAAKVLRMTNSAYYSYGREVSNLRAAVTRLGQTALCQLVLASEVFTTGKHSSDAEAMRGRALRISQLAGQLLPGPSADLAATAGLLAEVGLLLPPLEGGQDGGALPPPMAGAYLLGLWGLPSAIVEAVAFHQTPSRVGGSFWVTGAVHVAAALINGSEVDEDYLRTVGRLDQLPHWRALANVLPE